MHLGARTHERTRLSSHQSLFSRVPYPSSFRLSATANASRNGLLSFRCVVPEILARDLRCSVSFTFILCPKPTALYPLQNRGIIMPGSPRASPTSAPLSPLQRPRPASSPSSNSHALTPPQLYSPFRVCLADSRRLEKDDTPILQVLRPLHTPLPCFVAAVARVRTIAAAASFCSGTSSMAAIKGGRLMAAASPKLCSSSTSMPASATLPITMVQRKLDWKRVCLALVQEKKGDASVRAMIWNMCAPCLQ